MPSHLFKLVLTHVNFLIDDQIISLVKVQNLRHRVIVRSEKLHLNLVVATRRPLNEAALVLLRRVVAFCWYTFFECGQSVSKSTLLVSLRLQLCSILR